MKMINRIVESLTKVRISSQILNAIFVSRDYYELKRVKSRKCSLELLVNGELSTKLILSHIRKWHSKELTSFWIVS